MSIKLRKEVVASQIIAASRPLRLRKAHQVADDMVKFATDIVGDEFVTDRPPSRRRTADIHLINAFRSEVIEDGDSITAVLTTKRGVSDVKVRVMNNGAAPHAIRPQGQFLKFPGFVEGFTGKQNAFFNAYSPDVSARARVVQHPGRSRSARGTQFMQRARRRAIARLQ